MEFGGRRPYRLRDERQSSSGRWEIWMDAAQARAERVAQPEDMRGEAVNPRVDAAGRD
jgi:hypothetical protein